ncbi:MAG TPA: M48 family metallopeptidase [Pirellulales bacterium]|nr:M48 family metallopeptidase [Pirellulales bacterium]
MEAEVVSAGPFILDSFQGSIEPVSVGLGYKLSVALVLVFMLLLPVAYVAVIGLVCLLLGLHAVHDTALLHAGRGRGAVLAVILYAAPLLAGGILVFFMFKPLFARRVKRGKPRSLDRNQEPLLFAFVDRVCAVVGAPRPSRIDVDCDVNASASFRRGLLSMLGNDLVLTIGLPLVAGLDTRQFAGVLAHEFGHFSQGAGMRLSYLVRSVSFWLTRVVYERDEWDARLVAWSQGLDIRIGIIFFMARLFVWLTRKILWMLMMLGHLISGILMREMEFDADCYEARLAGSDSFESSTRRMAILNAATQGAFADLGDFAREGRLADDLPRLIVANVDQITPAGLESINKAVDEETTGLFSTHPASRDRIERAQEEQAPGIFHVELPAATLFRDFTALSRTCTFDLYRSLFGKGFKLTDMHPVEQLLAKQAQTIDDIKSLKRYFQGTFSLLRPLRLPAASTTEGTGAGELAAQLKQARQAMLDRLPAHKAAFPEYDQADTDWLEAEAADALLTAQIRVKSDDFKQRLVDLNATRQARAASRARLEQISPQLAPLEQLAVRRLWCALELVQVEKVAARIPQAQERIEHGQRVRAAVAVAGAQVGTWLALRNRMSVLRALFSRMEGQRENATLLGSLEKNISLLARQIRHLQFELSQVRYPFDHAKGEPTLSEFLLPQPFSDNDWNAVLTAGGTMLDGFPTLYARLFGRLTALAEDVESLLGLPRLAEPEPEDERQPAA